MLGDPWCGPIHLCVFDVQATPWREMLRNKYASTIALPVPAQGYSDETIARTSDLRFRGIPVPWKL